MKKIKSLSTVLLILLSSSALSGSINFDKLDKEMDKAAARAHISTQCGSKGEKIRHQLRDKIEKEYRQLEKIAPGEVNSQKLLEQTLLPLSCEYAIKDEVRNGNLSLEEALATAAKTK